MFLLASGSVSSDEFDAHWTTPSRRWSTPSLRRAWTTAMQFLPGRRSRKSTTDTLQRVLNAAARLVTNTDKYDRGLSSLLHDQLHWLNVPERIEYKLAVMIRWCLEDKAPTYLSDYCIPVTAVISRHLRSVNQHQLTVPRCRRITFGHRAFSVVGPMVWNSLQTKYRDLSVGFGVFWRTVKTILFVRY